MYSAKKSILVILLFIFSIFATLSAQEVDRKGFTGISTGIQSNQLDIMIPIWTNNYVVVIPSVSFVDIGGRQSDLGLGLMLRHNLKSEEVVPYIGVRVGMLYFSPDNNEAITDYVFGLAFGGEYFIKDKFSFGIEAQLNMTKSNEFSSRFGNPDGTTLNTASVAFMSIYF